MPRAEAIKPIVVKGKPVNKANNTDLLLNNPLISGINNIKVIIKKEPQLSLVVRFSKPKKVQVIKLLSNSEVETPWKPIKLVKLEHQPPPKSSIPLWPLTPLTSLNKHGLEDYIVPSPETPACQPRGPTKRTRKFT
jgi:hypothetical protein